MTVKIRTFFQSVVSSAIWVLISVNVLVFIGVHLLNWCGVSTQTIATTLPLPASVATWFTHPWTALTYMFLQWDFMHLTFNMLWLWCFGMLATRLYIPWRTTVAAYLTAGLCAAAIFLAMNLVMPSDGGILLGSSAAVMGVIGAVGVLRGKQKVSFMLIGYVQVRWMAAAVIALELIISGTDHGWQELVAHAAGALAGMAVGACATYRRKKSIPDPAALRPKPFSGRGAQYGPMPKRGLTPAEQAELDSLLDSVRDGGYNALTINQRIRLFDLSAKIK